LKKVSLENNHSQIRSGTDTRADEVIDLTGSPPPPQRPRHINRSPVSRPPTRETAMRASESRLELSKVSESAAVKASQEDVSLPLLSVPNQKTIKHLQKPGPKEKTKVQLLLDCLHKFDSSVYRMLQDITLSTPEEASLETKELWTSATATRPQTFESRFCWRSYPPSGVDLIIRTCNSIAARKQAEAKGTADDYEDYVPAFSKSLYDENLDPLTAIAQLSHPDITKPAALVGYRLPDLVPDGSLVCPEALTQFVEPFKEENLQILLTPEFWVTDLHIGITINDSDPNDEANLMS
jgi:hypothetical protein